jgi:hypothetical protein
VSMRIGVMTAATGPHRHPKISSNEAANAL